MIEATFFENPDGVKKTITVRYIDEEDAQYIKENGILISMEDPMNLGPVVYADIGRKLEDGTPKEIIVISKGRSCSEAFNELVRLCKIELGEKND